MAAPSYTEDLTDIDLADGATGWDESSDGAWDDQGSPAYQDNEYPYIQGSYAVTADCSKSGVGTLIANYGSGFSMPTDGAFLVWVNFSSPQNLATYANGGIRILCGDSLGDFYSWDVGGSDFGRYPYGGWQCFAANPSVTADDTVGTPTGTWQYFGAAVNVTTGISKGEVFQVDAIRAGRCSAIFEYGDLSNGYCTIEGFATQNDTSTNMWGLIQKIPGGYLWKGRMQLGSVTNAVDFQDSNKIIFIDVTPKVTANFNTIEVINASSNVVMSGFQFICLDPSTTASAGRWLNTNNATVSLTNCTFSDMSTFVFGSNTTVDTCTFRRCGQVTQSGADFDDCIFDDCDAAVSLLSDNPDNIDNCVFNSDGSNHAIELDTACAGNTYTLAGCTFNNYATSDGSTGNEVIFNDSGGAVTINASNCVGTISVRNGTGASTTISSSVPVSVTVYDESQNYVENARVGVYTNDTSRTQIINSLTNASGVADGSWTGSTPQSVEVRVRKASSGSTKYINFSAIQTIGASGLDFSVTLREDINNNSTS